MIVTVTVPSTVKRQRQSQQIYRDSETDLPRDSNNDSVNHRNGDRDRDLKRGGNSDSYKVVKQKRQRLRY